MLINDNKASHCLGFGRSRQAKTIKTRLGFFLELHEEVMCTVDMSATLA